MSEAGIEDPALIIGKDPTDQGGNKSVFGPGITKFTINGPYHLAMIAINIKDVSIIFLSDEFLRIYKWMR